MIVFHYHLNFFVLFLRLFAECEYLCEAFLCVYDWGHFKQTFNTVSLIMLATHTDNSHSHRQHVASFFVSLWSAAFPAFPAPLSTFAFFLFLIKIQLLTLAL